jgi:uncharacterized protein
VPGNIPANDLSLHRRETVPRFSIPKATELVMRGRLNRSATDLALQYGMLVGLACSAVPVSSAEAQDPMGRCWHGELARESLEWDLRLEVANAETAPEATLGLDALWRARQPLPSFRTDGGVVTFDLPWSMGEFRGEVGADALTGRVSFEDGRQEPVSLGPVACPVRLEEEMTWRTGDVSVAGTLVLPPGPGPFPAVVVLHGGGDSSRESPPYAFWSEYLPRLGIAVLSYDKRGNGMSTGDWRSVGFEERAADVAGGLNQLRGNAAIDPDRLGLLAVSQGSWIAGLVARMDPSVRFIVHISGPAVSVVEADTYAVESQLRREGWAQEAMAERLDLWRLNADVARHPESDEDWNRLQSALERVRDREWFRRSPYEPERYSSWRTWYHHVLDYDPEPTLRDLHIPMFWIFGSMDSESDPATNVKALEDLRRSGKEYTIGVYPGAGHGILIPVRPDGTQGDLLTTPPGFFPDLRRWLFEQTVTR